jgi:DNA repair exonuclease SbcCD ATPase subunit
VTQEEWLRGYNRNGRGNNLLTIKEITVKNFMSVGNQAQAIDFSNKSLVLVIGENMDLGGDDAGARNGTGKTTIINALVTCSLVRR